MSLVAGSASSSYIIIGGSNTAGLSSPPCQIPNFLYSSPSLFPLFLSSSRGALSCMSCDSPGVFGTCEGGRCSQLALVPCVGHMALYQLAAAESMWEVAHAVSGWHQLLPCLVDCRLQHCRSPALASVQINSLNAFKQACRRGAGLSQVHLTCSHA